MRFSLSSNWNSRQHKTADTMLEEIRELGFDSVELGYALTQQQAEGVAEWVSSGRIAVSSVHAFCPSPIPNRPDPEIFSLCDPSDLAHGQRGISAAKGTADFAASVGAKAVVLHAGRVPIYRHIARLVELASSGKHGSPAYQRQIAKIMQKRDKYFKRHLDTLCRSLDVILPHFERLGIALGLENLPTYDAIPNEAELQLLLDAFDTPAFGYWHDIGHGQVRQNMGFIHHSGVVSRFADRIVGMHIHDVSFPDTDHVMPPGGGTVDFRIFRPLLDFNIPFVLEPARGSSASSITTAVHFLSELWSANEQSPKNTNAVERGQTTS